MTPGASSPLASIGHYVLPPNGRNHQQQEEQTRNDNHFPGHVPEALLIDFDTEPEANNSRNSNSSEGADVDRTFTAVQNVGRLLPFGITVEDERRSVFESTGSSNTSGATSPAVIASLQPQFSEYTDLHLLLSRLEGQNSDGADYDVNDICPTPRLSCD